jgi:hypothetical protein
MAGIGAEQEAPENQRLFATTSDPSPASTVIPWASFDFKFATLNRGAG